MHGPRRHGNALEFAHFNDKHKKGPWWKNVHRDWRVWTGLVLMVLAMVVYVLSVDESMRPWGGSGQQQQAAP